MKVLVCGGREYNDRKFMFDTLMEYWNASREIIPFDKNIYHLEIISGMAPGADAFGAEFAKHMRLKLHEFPADWKSHGRAAGPIRNQKMVDEGKPDLVIAFPGGRGTADMIRRAESANIPVIRPGERSER